MKKQQTDKDNKLIAEFMGGRHVFEGDPESGGGWTWRGLKKNTPDLKYHSSMNWLMPVVEKISSLGYYFEINNEGVHWSGDKERSKFICSFYTNKHPTKRFPEITRKFGNTLQTATYKAVVSFINKRNNQKNNEDLIKSSL